jgi:hypothetical protein
MPAMLPGLDRCRKVLHVLGGEDQPEVAPEPGQRADRLRGGILELVDLDRPVVRRRSW